MLAVRNGDHLCKRSIKASSLSHRDPCYIESHGDQPAGQGKVSKALHGEANYQTLAIFSFSAVVSAEAWCRSDTYQALIPNWDETLGREILVLESL